MLNVDFFERQYRDHLSGYKQWDQRVHAEDWILFSKNMASYIGIDEVALSRGGLYTVVINKEAHGKKGSIIAIVKGTRSEDVCDVLLKMPRRRRFQARWEALDREAIAIHHAKTKGEKYTAPVFENGDSLKQLPARSWYLLFKKETLWTFSQQQRAKILFREYPDIVNFFHNRSTNAASESFNAKIKAFRCLFRGVKDKAFFLFRLSKLYA